MGVKTVNSRKTVFEQDVVKVFFCTNENEFGSYFYQGHKVILKSQSLGFEPLNLSYYTNSYDFSKIEAPVRSTKKSFQIFEILGILIALVV